MIRELFETEIEEISGGRPLLVIPPPRPTTSGRTRAGRRALRQEIRDRRSLLAEQREGVITLFGGNAATRRLRNDIRAIRNAIRNRTTP